MKMLKGFVISFFSVILAVNVYLVVTNFRAYGCVGRTPIDFRLRMNECECLKERFNPFLISTGQLKHERYVPLHALDGKAVADHLGEPVGMYPPWSYSLFLPFSCVSRDLAWTVWYGLSVLSLLGFGLFAFLYGRRSAFGLTGGVFCSAAALSVFAATVVDLWCGNMCLMIAFPLVGLACSIMRPGPLWSFVGGVSLSVAMMKPQLGLLFAVPLLLSKRYGAIAVAAVLTLVFSIIPSALCRTSPVVMALQAPRAAEPGFHGCGLMPDSVATWICSHFHVGLNVPLVLAILIGLTLCVALSWRLRAHPSALVRMLPASVLSVSWTYTAFYNYAVCWIALAVLAVEFLQAPLGRRVLLAACFFLFARGSRFVVRVAELAGLSKPDDPFGGWGGLFTGFCNSASVVALVVVCFIIWRKDDAGIAERAI